MISWRAILSGIGTSSSNFFKAAGVVLSNPALAGAYLATRKNHKPLLNAERLDRMMAVVSKAVGECQTYLFEHKETVTAEERLVHQLLPAMFQGVLVVLTHLRELRVSDIPDLVNETKLKQKLHTLNKELVSHFSDPLSSFLLLMGLEQRDIDFVLHQGDFDTKPGHVSCTAGEEYLRALFPGAFFEARLSAELQSPSEEQITKAREAYIQAQYVKSLSPFPWFDRLMWLIRFKGGDILQPFFRIIFQGKTDEAPNYTAVRGAYKALLDVFALFQDGLKLDQETGLIKTLFSQGLGEGYDAVKAIYAADNSEKYRNSLKQLCGSTYQVTEVIQTLMQAVSAVAGGIFDPKAPVQSEGFAAARAQLEKDLDSIEETAATIDQKLVSLIGCCKARLDSDGLAEAERQDLEVSLSNLQSAWAKHHDIYHRFIPAQRLRLERQILKPYEESMQRVQELRGSALDPLIAEAAINKEISKQKNYEKELKAQALRMQRHTFQDAVATALMRLCEIVSEITQGEIRLPSDSSEASVARRRKGPYHVEGEPPQALNPIPLLVSPAPFVSMVPYLVQCHILAAQYEQYLDDLPGQVQSFLNAASAFGDKKAFPAYLIHVLADTIQHKILDQSMRKESANFYFLIDQFIKSIRAAYPIPTTVPIPAEPSATETLPHPTDNGEKIQARWLGSDYEKHYVALKEAVSSVQNYFVMRSLCGPSGTKPKRWWRFWDTPKDRDKRLNDWHAVFDDILNQGKNVVLQNLDQRIRNFGGWHVPAWHKSLDWWSNVMNIWWGLWKSIKNIVRYRSRRYANALKVLYEAVRTMPESCAVGEGDERMTLWADLRDIVGRLKPSTELAPSYGLIACREITASEKGEIDRVHHNLIFPMPPLKHFEGTRKTFGYVSPIIREWGMPTMEQLTRMNGDQYRCRVS